MNRARVLMRATMCLLVVATVAAAGCERAAPLKGPVAAVMDAKGTVVMVDLAAGRVVRTVRMRSWTGDIAADPSSGSFVTAQTGGLGDEADDAVGIIDVRAGGPPRYVSLPRRNPGGVEVVGPGLTLVDHGWQERDGMFSCLVDTRARRVVRQGHIPDNNAPSRAVAGSVWSSGVDPLTGETSLSRVDTSTMTAAVLRRGGDYPIIECPTGPRMAGYLRPQDGAPMLALFDAATAAVEMTAPVGLRDGPGRMVFTGGRLVVTDFEGTDLDARRGGGLRVFDAHTLQAQREIDIDGVATDVAVWGDRVVAVSWRDQVLHVIDPATGRIERRVRLPKIARLPLMVAVLEGKA